MSTDGDFTDTILYRMAYGLAADLAEIRRFDHGWSRAFASGVGDERRAIEAEVRARLGAGQGELPSRCARWSRMRWKDGGCGGDISMRRHDTSIGRSGRPAYRSGIACSLRRFASARPSRPLPAKCLSVTCPG